jgi:hypothetical protein
VGENGLGIILHVEVAAIATLRRSPTPRPYNGEEPRELARLDANLSHLPGQEQKITRRCGVSETPSKRGDQFCAGGQVELWFAKIQREIIDRVHYTSRMRSPCLYRTASEAPVFGGKCLARVRLVESTTLPESGSSLQASGYMRSWLSLVIVSTSLR